MRHFTQLGKEVLLVLSILCMISFTACNDSKDADSKTEKTTGDTDIKLGNKNTNAQLSPDVWTGSLPTLLMTKTGLEAIFAQTGAMKCKKIVFVTRFSDLTSSTGSSQSLGAFGLKDANRYMSDAPQEILTAVDRSVIPHANISGEIFFGDIQLSRKQYEDLKTDAGSGYKDATHLMFSPVRGDGAHAPWLVYKVRFVRYATVQSEKDIQKFGTTEELLKPSPPAPPVD
jgi:hypothetical protein